VFVEVLLKVMGKTIRREGQFRTQIRNIMDRKKSMLKNKKGASKKTRVS